MLKLIASEASEERNETKSLQEDIVSRAIQIPLAWPVKLTKYVRNERISFYTNPISIQKLNVSLQHAVKIAWLIVCLFFI